MCITPWIYNYIYFYGGARGVLKVIAQQQIVVGDLIILLELFDNLQTLTIHVQTCVHLFCYYNCFCCRNRQLENIF